MKKFILLSLSYLLFINFCLGQHSHLEVNLDLKSCKILSDSDFVAIIKVTNKFPDTLFIEKTPFYNVLESEFGDVKFEIQKMNKECFQKMSIDVDIFDEKTLLKSKNLIPLAGNKSVVYQYYLGDILPIGRGYYRFRVHYLYYKNQKKYIAISDWSYFQFVI